MFDPELAIGQTLTNDEIQAVFKCGGQGGMRRSHATNALLITTGAAKESPYRDRWVDGILYYTGMGQSGPQDLGYAQNRTLAESDRIDIGVFLMEKVCPNSYVYRGRVELAGEPYQEIQPGADSHPRAAWVFPLRVVASTGRHFDVEPSEFVQGVERELAAHSLRAYFAPGAFSGALFERLADMSSPYEVSARDIVAVGSLGVNVPPRAADWLLSEGRPALGRHLLSIDPDASIRGDVDMSCKSAAWQLWDLVRGLDGVGPTTASKLLAAKRPRLVPIWDRYVVEALRPAPGQYWAGWHKSFAGASGADLVATCEELRAEASVPERVSDLRLMDIVIWMRVHGHHWMAAEDAAPYGAEPRFWDRPRT